MADFGYAGEVLKVDLSRGEVDRLATSDYAERFLGGRGLAAKLYWDIVPPGTKAYDSDNCLIFVTGPVAGFAGFAGSRWQVCGKSPAMDPESFSYANMGGSWGSLLKFAGYDGLVVRGRAEKPVYLLINSGSITLKDASHLKGKTAFEASDSIKAELGNRVSVITIGPAAENLVSFATMLADEGASGSSGFGSVMGSKNLKAIAVTGDKRPVAAYPERLRDLAKSVRSLIPTDIRVLPWVIPGRTKKKTCYGCGIGCSRQSYKDETGRTFKSFCQPADYYRRPAEKFYDGWSEVVLYSIRLVDHYGLDTCVMQPMIEWLIRCYKEGVIGDKETGLPLSRIGSTEFIEQLIRKIAFREGFGDLLAQGTIKAANSIGGRARELISYSVVTRASESKDYDPRLILHNALLFAIEPRRPINQLHQPSRVLMNWLGWVRGAPGAYLSSEVSRKIAQRFWGSELGADYSTYEGKALAVKKIEENVYAKECLILCDFIWPIMSSGLTDDHVGDPTLESRIAAAVTGRDFDEAGLNEIGERVFNLQRAIFMRQGWGGREGDRLLAYLHEEPIQYLRFDRDCIVPGREGATVSRKGMVVDRVEFEKMKSEFYELCGWDAASGFQKREALERLQLGDVADDLEARRLLR